MLLNKQGHAWCSSAKAGRGLGSGRPMISSPGGHVDSVPLYKHRPISAIALVILEQSTARAGLLDLQP